jgi:hypothetical protein
VRQTISRKGRRFLKAPTRSLRDRLDAEDAPIAAEPEGRRVSRPPLLYCRGIRRIPGIVGLGLRVALQGRHVQLRSKPRRRNARKAWRRQVLETLEPEACFQEKRAVLLPGRLKVVAWNLIPQRPCTAVTLFAAIPCQDRQQTVDSSVTSATHWRHFQTPAGSSARRHQKAYACTRGYAVTVRMEQSVFWLVCGATAMPSAIGRAYTVFGGSDSVAYLHPLPRSDV